MRNGDREGIRGKREGGGGVERGRDNERERNRDEG